jgi:DNA-binding GntR family transcriptional regulator
LRYFPPGALIIADIPELNPVGTSQRSSYQQPRHRKLSADLVKVIQERPHHTLRELAEKYGVSHETIRSVLKR